jgi:putative effector of murein hydrolase
MEIEDLEQIKHYLKSLQKVVTYGADFKLFTNYLIKKNKIDDTYVCFLSLLPKSFKTAINIKKFEKVPSIVYYKILFDSIKGKFILNNGVYLVNYEKAVNCINGLINNLAKDIEFIEKNL